MLYRDTKVRVVAHAMTLNQLECSDGRLGEGVHGIAVNCDDFGNHGIFVRLKVLIRGPTQPAVPMLFCSHCENAAHSQRSIVPARQHR